MNFNGNSNLNLNSGAGIEHSTSSSTRATATGAEHSPSDRTVVYTSMFDELFMDSADACVGGSLGPAGQSERIEHSAGPPTEYSRESELFEVFLQSLTGEQIPQKQQQQSQQQTTTGSMSSPISRNPDQHERETIPPRAEEIEIDYGEPKDVGFMKCLDHIASNPAYNPNIISLLKHCEFWKAMHEAENITFLCPTAEAFHALGDDAKATMANDSTVLAELFRSRLIPH